MRTAVKYFLSAWLAALLFSAVVAAQHVRHIKVGNVTESGYSSRDFSGVWMARKDSIVFSTKEPPMQPWAQARFNTAKPSYGPRASVDTQDPLLQCLPPGVPRILLLSFPIQIAQLPGQIVMLFEYDHFVRQIYMDRQTHPATLDLSWMGDSIGKWEGDTLVVDTVGLNDRTWLDQVGHPHSDALHVIERLKRTNRTTLVDDVTIDDPKAYTHSWIGQQVFTLRPGWHLMEYVCEDSMPAPRN